MLRLVPDEEAETWHEVRRSAQTPREGLPRVFDVGRVAGWHFLVMELVERERPSQIHASRAAAANTAGQHQAHAASLEATRRVAAQRQPRPRLQDALRIPPRWRRPVLWAIGALLTAAVTWWVALPWIAPAPFCPRGTSPSFGEELATLQGRLGGVMGAPRECSHPNPENGDELQVTSRGLAFARGPDRVPHFTTGHEHWALTERGLLYWTGDSVDPPRGAAVVPPGNRGVRP